MSHVAKKFQKSLISLTRVLYRNEVSIKSYQQMIFLSVKLLSVHTIFVLDFGCL